MINLRRRLSAEVQPIAVRLRRLVYLVWVLILLVCATAVGALQVQARSASSIIVSLPIAFLVVLSSLHSPYLAAFHNPAGEAFLLGMLAIMGCSYIWMRRLLQLPGLERVRLGDA